MKIKTRDLAIMGMLAALAFLTVLFIRIPVVVFLKYEPKDVIITISGFIFGPLAVLLISTIVSLIEWFTISETGHFGFIMNVISTCSFACTAALIYKYKRTMLGAVIGLVTGLVIMCGVMLLWNYLIVPLYMPFVTAAGKASQPDAYREAVLPMLTTIFLPFNLLKGGLNGAITLLLYKPIKTALNKTKLLPETEAAKSAKINFGLILVSVFVIITCVMFILSWRGII